MSLKNFLAALALSSVAAFAGLGLFPASATAAAPQSERTQLDQQLGLHAKKPHKKPRNKKGNKGAKAGGKHHHKKGKKA